MRRIGSVTIPLLLALSCSFTPSSDLGKAVADGSLTEVQRLLAAGRRMRVVEHDHRATHSPKAAGRRRRRTRATCRRTRQASGPRDGTNTLANRT